MTYMLNIINYLHNLITVLFVGCMTHANLSQCINIGHGFPPYINDYKQLIQNPPYTNELRILNSLDSKRRTIDSLHGTGVKSKQPRQPFLQ